MFWLDWKLFGNGHGMASPFWDDTFYWLNGRFYRWFGGFGAQLSSIEWFAPSVGTRRKLFGHQFQIFSTHRKWMRVECNWGLVDGVKDAVQLLILENELQKWRHGIL